MAGSYDERARALVGTRFRPQGRGQDGLDCIGLILATFDIRDGEVRGDYRLRGDHRAEMEQALGRLFRRVSEKDARAGDVILLEITADQLHLGVRTSAGFVHAHAGIGRVVETPGEPEWRLLGTYRKRLRSRSA